MPEWQLGGDLSPDTIDLGQDAAIALAAVSHPKVTAAAVRSLIHDKAISEAHDLISEMLELRIRAGDTELAAVALLLQHYLTIIARQPPLSHTGIYPLRPSEQLYTCFDELLGLLHQQGRQIAELQTMITELV